MDHLFLENTKSVDCLRTNVMKKISQKEQAYKQAGLPLVYCIGLMSRMMRLPKPQFQSKSDYKILIKLPRIFRKLLLSYALVKKVCPSDFSTGPHVIFFRD